MFGNIKQVIGFALSCKASAFGKYSVRYGKNFCRISGRGPQVTDS